LIAVAAKAAIATGVLTALTTALHSSIRGLKCLIKNFGMFDSSNKAGPSWDGIIKNY
jgi:hypothetical protein